MIDKGYAQIADTSNDKIGKVWFIPHHAVIAKNKKPRVVFDCNAKFEGRSLNEEMLKGPDLVNSASGVMIRFREEDYAFTADIEAMYLQVKVPKEQRSFLRFLWWPNGNLESEPVVYEMCAHLFGATSSGSCANYTVKQAAKEGEAKVLGFRFYYLK